MLERVDGDALRYHKDHIDLTIANSSHTQLVLLTGHDKRVLEVGPATGAVTEALKARGCRVTCIEMDPEAAKLASRYCERMIIGDIEQLDLNESLGGEKFDVVMFGDVLEHLRSPGGVLAKVAAFLEPEGRIVASVPNIAHGSVRLALLSGHFDYTETGHLDRTHLRFFTRASLRELFQGAGYDIRDWKDIDEDSFNTTVTLEEAHFPRDLVEAIQADPDARAYQFVVSAAYDATAARDAPSPKISGVAPALRRLLDREQDLVAREAEAGELQREVDNLRIQQDELRAAYQDLQSQVASESFQTYQALARIAGRLAPKGSFREAIARAVVRGADYLTAAGPIAFTARLLQVWTWLPRAMSRSSRPDVSDAPRPILARAVEYRRRHGWRAFLSKTRQEAAHVARSKILGRRNPSPPNLEWILDKELPASLEIGFGTAIFVHGWCRSTRGRIEALRFLVNGSPREFDTRRSTATGGYPTRAFASQEWRDTREFWAIVAVEAGVDRLEIELRAVLGSGEALNQTLGVVTVRAGGADVAHSGAQVHSQPLIAICMTTYNPPPSLFQRQVDSIRAQSYTNWICIVCDDNSESAALAEIRRVIGDDPRFVLHAMPERRGFYHNFERCLSLVPPDASFVTLSDHDDNWHSDKLVTLLNAFRDGTTLVYSDMNIVDENLTVLSNTYWTTRRNNYRRLDQLFLANTITGAASMFRRDLLSLLLPFPPQIGEPYHDHWIGLVALSTGNIEYVDRPLYDYVQHGANALGHYAPPSPPSLKRTRDLLARLLTGAWLKQRNYAGWRDVFFYDVARLRQAGVVLDLRLRHVGLTVPRAKRRVIDRIVGLDRSGSALAWLAWGSLAGLIDSNTTLGAEGTALGGVLWARIVSRGFALSRAPALPSAASPAPSLAQELQPAIEADNLRDKIAPLRLQLSSAAPKRVNLLVPTIDFDYFFAGYIVKFNFARRLAEEGARVRVVLVDYCDYKPDAWRERFRAYRDLENILDQVEFEYHFDRTKCLRVSPEDRFVATTWWTAHIAHDAVKQMGGRRFLYLIQEFEPFTFPMGSLAAMARETYNFPHTAVFSSALLQEYFDCHSIGVFRDGKDEGERLSQSFEVPIAPPSVPLAAPAERRVRRLLFYARPEAHAARNMFEMGLLALNRVIDAGVFGEEWEFHGVGSVGPPRTIPLARGRSLLLLPRQSQEQYTNLLPNYDVGLSLMYTPHPSLPPIDMAAAGIPVVTNTFENKTSEKLALISSNIIAVEPAVEAVAAGLTRALKASDNWDARLAGSRVKWSDSWEHSFSPEFIARTLDLLATES